MGKQRHGTPSKHDQQISNDKQRRLEKPVPTQKSTKRFEEDKRLKPYRE